jgi:hypothetical protein
MHEAHDTTGLIPGTFYCFPFLFPNPLISQTGPPQRLQWQIGKLANWQIANGFGIWLPQK